MDTLRKFKKDLEKKLGLFLASGNFDQANEVTANMMVGAMLVVIILLMGVCLLLNEVGVFTADKKLMRVGMITALIIQIPIATMNQLLRGDRKWLKYVLMIGLLALCACLMTCLGHNVILVMVIPIVLSIRYFDAKFTGNLIWISYLIFLTSCYSCAQFGIINLNVLKLPSGTVLTIDGTLRDAIMAQNPDRNYYFTSFIVNDLLPRLLIFGVIAFTCFVIAKRGRQMIDMQNEFTQKSSRIETELNLATQIQTGMLPCIFPAFPSFSQLDLYAKNVPAKEVGGDFYDYFQVDDDHIALVMADVSGKGVGAALFMTISKIVIKNLFQTGNGPAEALTKANQQLCENNEAGLFVTTWAGVYEISTGTMTYTNAGHNPPIIRRKDGTCEYLTGKTGFVLAGMDGTKYKEQTIPFNVGDELFLYTDGVTEATDINNNLYGEDRLLETIKSIQGLPVEQQIGKVFDDINVFVKEAEQFDDITMMALRVLGNSQQENTEKAEQSA